MRAGTTSLACALAAALTAMAVGCDNGSAEHGQSAHTPAPGGAKVKPFPMDEPHVVLLLSGGTNGKMELCNCSGPMPGGLARRSGLIRSYRARFPRVMAVDVGDAFWIEPNSIRNDYVLRGLSMVGYDAIALGDQEFMDRPRRLERRLADAPATYLSTTVTQPGGPKLPTRRVVKRKWDRAKIAVLNNLQREWLLFFPDRREQQLRFVPTAEVARKVGQLKSEGFCTVVIVHGDDTSADETAEATQPDLLVRAHTTQTEKTIRRHAGVPILKVGHPEMVAAAALKLAPDGRLEDIQYRVEVVTADWPMDYRLIQLYQAFVHEALREELDQARKIDLQYVSPKRCAECHQAEHDWWKRSDHGRAFRTIERAGRTGDRDCLKCHTTGHGRADGFVSKEKTPHLAGASCQSCHRVNLASHAANPEAKIPKAGAETCALCHTPITSPGFNFKKARKKVLTPAHGGK
jgi:hypothetical protein